jgi:poly-gamma-glutamate capsule biosynthesis protein CapA/YwtB (metallophosphatase superfamily)
VTAVGTPWLSLAEEGRPARHETASISLAGFETGAGDDPVVEEGRQGPSRDPRRSARIVLSGDLLWHDTVWASAQADGQADGLADGQADGGGRFDFDPMFAALRPLIQGADLAVCHEEVPFAAPGAALQSYPVFAAPPAIAGWIGSMGWDVCTTASNHAVDQGYDGLVRTANLLEAAGVAHVGTFRTLRERRTPVIMTTEAGVEVAIVSGTYSLNGFPPPAGHEWSVSMWDARNLIAQARAAKRAGADIVIVKYHGGDEYSAMPNAQQVALARALTASPYVDVVVGEHAHVVQPITRVNGKWVVYGLGNAVAQSEVSQPRAYEGITVAFTFRETRHAGFVVDRAEYVPTYWNHYAAGHPIRVQRVVQALAHGVARDEQGTARLREALAATRTSVNLLGHPRGLVLR